MMGNSADGLIRHIGKPIALLCLTLAGVCHAQTSTDNLSVATGKEAISVDRQESAQSPVVLASVAPSSQPDTSLLSSSPRQETTIANAITNSLAADETSAEKKAVTAAVADGITTGLALSFGASEVNPVITATPLGIVAVTGAKLALLKYADSMPEEQKRFTLKTSSAVWGGAAVNNLMVLFAAPPPAPLIAGVLMGIFTWKQMSEQYDENDRIAAARRQPAPRAEEESVAALTDGAASSGQ